ncbi:MAG TPA: UTP--glucose-1-phosphate uridylyltransferase [Baekduia sp.]|nr:UTP--glucose-1-phosphate uridylyltransferase [Baekduia sp.]HMJ35947.1 UTP--glucose-1-phosphate uridylyltransferase [Baekduia sp.]
MDGLQSAIEKMRAEGLGDAAVESFARQYERLRAGETGTLAESEIEPVAGLPDAEDLQETASPELLDQAVVIKLNGGLGTSMGMTKAKSLLEVKGGRTFLDLIAEQILDRRRRSGARLPLILMNSFATRDDSLAALARYDDLSAGLPADFVQNKVPKIREDDLAPAEWPDDPALEWAPPGHGDLYTALVTSGMLEALIADGYRYAFVSNSDNLGAVLDPRILAWLAQSRAPFLMEVADRTSSDRKGGHLARRRSDGGLVLREIAQTPGEDVEAFQDTARHRYFNTNTLWVDLHALRDVLSGAGVIDLPMIVNRKTVDPGDTSSTPVIQLETAMGAAIGVFEGAAALRVPRSRFVPVKTTNDLLSLRSDAYVIGEGRAVHLAPQRQGVPPFVDLDSHHYKLVADFDARFPRGAPSLVGCDALHVHGDVTFGAGVTVRGEITVEGPAEIADGTVLEGERG